MRGQRLIPSAVLHIPIERETPKGHDTLPVVPSIAQVCLFTRSPVGHSGSLSVSQALIA